MPNGRRSNRARRCDGDTFQRRDPRGGHPRARSRRTENWLCGSRGPRRSRTAAGRSDAMKTLTRVLQPRGLLVAMHAPFVAFTAARSVTGLCFEPSGTRWSALPLVLAAAAIQVHHSLVAAEGVRPRHWKWTLVLLVLIVFLPIPVFLN